jgi:hypothetical protein
MNPDDTLSSGALPGLVNPSITTPFAPSISTLTPNPSSSHVPSKTTPIPSTSASASTPTSSGTADYAKLHTALGSNGLLKIIMNTIPKLTGHDDYILWSDQILAAFRYCGVDKILTGDWPAPAVIAGDTATETNAHEWNCIDSFIQLNMGLSNEVRSQVRHLHTSSERWLKLKKLYQPTSATSITLHLTSIVNVRFDDSTKFEDFVAGKREHNHLLGELGGQSLPDSYIAILIRSGLPEHLHQTVAHIADDKITTDQLVNIVRSRQQESMINTMQTSSSDTTLFGRKGKPNQKKRDFQPCRTAGCPKLETHPTKNCWAPGGPKYDPNRQRKSDRGGVERAHKINEGDDDDDGGATSMNILIDRSFFATQSDSDLLYVSPSESSTSSMSSQAFIAEGSTPIIIDSGTTSHIHTERSDFDYLDKDDTNSITGFWNGSVSSSGRGTAVIWTKSPQRKDSVNRLSLTKALYVPSSNVSLLSLGTNPPVLSQYMLSTWWFHVQNTNTFLNQNMLSSFRIH